jgi:tRNA modification GTPase
VAAYVEDTIAALATAAGTGAIAIVRLSGREAVAVAQRILSSRGSGAPVQLRPSHRARVARLHRPDASASLDEVLVLPMLAPRSFTGEDVVEIHCHGGPLVADLALRAALEAGARAARPGEFSERAFLNGRMDLCQAEGVADLITASSEAGLGAARMQLEGLLSQEVLGIRDLLLDARALVEAHLDFPDEDLPPETIAELEGLLADAEERIARLAGTYARGRLARRGARVVLVGRPNAGKSSLMNALLGRDRAIVSPEAGTTRDYLDEPLAVGRFRLLLTDTAGIRTSESAVERAGVERTRQQIAAADLVILLLDRSEALTREDREALALTADRPRVTLRTKADLASGWEPSELAGERILEVSAHRGTGLEELTRRILAALPSSDDEAPREDVAVTRARHHAALVAARRSVVSGRESLVRQGASLDLVAADLQSACSELERLVGMSTPEDVLDRIFRRFCVGK